MLPSSHAHRAIAALLLAVATSAAAAPSAERPLAIDFTHSHVEVAVKATVDSFTGKLTRFEPAVRVDENGRVASARLSFHFRDVETGKPGRNEAMHKWQKTDSFPDGDFQLSSLEPAANGGFTAFGRLTFHGVTREIRFPVSITREGPVYAIDGDAVVDTREYNLPIIRMLGVLKVDPLVHVRFHLQGSLSSLTASNTLAR